MKLKPGKYRHFKGNEYEVLGVANHSETLEEMVVYRALYGEQGLWVRPLSMWLETVERDGQIYQAMRILIDGDGCPVVKPTLNLAREFSVPCIILCDTSHIFQDDYAEVVICDKGSDSVDYKLVNLVQTGDLVVTQDYGLAAMALSRKAIPIHQNGFCYTDDNIGGLLEARAFSGKFRRAGGRLKGQKKRTTQQDQDFIACLRRILEEHDAGRNH